MTQSIPINKASIDIEKIRADFPILSRKVNGKALIYFDNGATTQKPLSVIERIAHYYPAKVGLF